MVFLKGGLVNINNNLYSDFDVKKEGLLFLCRYVKGGESFLLFRVKCEFDDGGVYYLAETVNNKVVLYTRVLGVEGLGVVYPILLPVCCRRVGIEFISDMDVFSNDCVLELELRHNFWM